MTTDSDAVRAVDGNRVVRLGFEVLAALAFALVALVILKPVDLARPGSVAEICMAIVGTGALIA